MSVLDRKLRRDMGRRRGQFAAIVATVALGVALFGASYDAYQNLLASYQALFDQTNFAALTIEGGDRQAVSAAVQGTAGVASTASRSTAEVPVRVGDSTLIGRLVGLPTPGRAAVNDVLVLRGAYLEPGDPAGVLVERHMADHFGLKPGDSVEAWSDGQWQQLEVRGIVASAEYTWPARSRQEVLTLPDEFGVIFAPQELVDTLPPATTTHQVLVTYAGPADDPGLTATLTARARAAGATNVFVRADQPSNAALQEDIDGFGELSFLFPLMFLSAAGLATYVLLSRMVYAQRAQIGLLLAVGFRRRRVFRHYLVFGLATGLAGASIGAVLGLALAGAITRVYTDVIAIPTTVIALRPSTVVFGLAFGAFAGALASMAPALRAARLSPAAAMSGLVAFGPGSESLPERLLPPLRRLSARSKMVLRGIGRSPVRSASTVVGVMIAVTLILVSWGMLDTVEVLLDRQFAQVQQEDAVVYAASGAPDAQLEGIRTTDGVEAAEPLAQLPVVVMNGDASYSTTLSALPATTTMHRFVTPSGPIDLPAEGVLLGDALRAKLGLAQGDAVRLAIGAVGEAVDTRVAGFVDEPLGTYAYTSLDELSTLIGPGPAAAATTAANVRFAPDVSRSQVVDRLKQVPGVVAVVDVRGLQAAAQSLMGLFYAFVGAMLVLGAAMAFALLFNLMSANMSERVTELASLRASGMRGGELAGTITAENVLLTLVGIVPGLIVGYLAAAEFMGSFSSDLFSFALHVRPTTFLFTALGVIAAALISQLPILAAVRRIDIAQVVRERAS